MNYNISPGYIEAAGTRLLAGRDLTCSDDTKAPKVALVNRQFAVKVFGSVERRLAATSSSGAERGRKWWAWSKTGSTGR